MNPSDGKPPIIDRWTITSFVASVLAMFAVSLVLFRPDWKMAWIVVIGVMVFVPVSLRHPEHWYRRTATGMLAAEAPDPTADRPAADPAEGLGHLRSCPRAGTRYLSRSRDPDSALRGLGALRARRDRRRVPRLRGLRGRQQ